MNTVYQSGQYFNRDEPKYKCCCGNIHVTTGTKVIAILVAIGLSLQMINSVIAFTKDSGHGGVLGIGVGGLVIGVVIVICLFLGLRSQRATYLIPYLVFQALGMLLCILLIIVCIVVLVNTDGGFAHDFMRGLSSSAEDLSDNGVKIFAIVYIVVFAIQMLIEVWFFWVVYKCYVFFREQAAFAQKTTVGYSY